MNILSSDSSLPKAEKHGAIDGQSLDFARRAASLKRQETIGAIVGMGSLFSSLPITLLLDHFLGSVTNSGAWIVPATLVTAAVGGMLYGIVAGSKRSAMIRQARETRDRRKVGILLDAYQEFSNFVNFPLNDPTRPSRYKIKVVELTSILTHMLPQIEEGDGVLLSQKQRVVLRKLLQHANPYLVASALKALAKIGVSADLPPIENLAQGEWKAADDMQLRQTAQETAARIRERLAEQTHTATLLRAAAVPDSPPEILLRPAAPQPGQTEAQQLLRAENSERH